MVLRLRLGSMAMVIFGAFRNAQHAWALGDIGVGLMAWLNIIAILILHKPALLALKDYEAQRKAGQDPQFDPDALGRSEEHTSELQSLMRISYAVFCLKKTTRTKTSTRTCIRKTKQ